MYQVISYQDKKNWERELEQFNVRDVHYLYEYCNIYQKNGDGEPFLFIYKENNERKVGYTFIKRIIELPFINEELFDIITPLGFGGPLYDYADKELIRNFMIAFNEFCQNEKIISEFIRFHPLLKNHLFMEELMDIHYNRTMIYMDLRNDEEDMLKNYHNNHRRNIKKAIKNQLVFKVFTKDEAIQEVESFYALYKETMEKVKATSYYYFSTDYFIGLLTGLNNESLIGAVFFDGEMISAAFCLLAGGYLHYHLGCSRKEYLPLGTNVFLFHNLALWGKENGCHSFFLGGGHQDHDTLFNFKHRFNLSGNIPFYVGKKIHHQEIYNKLVDKWKEYYAQDSPEGFFPAYRPVSTAKPRLVISN